MEKKRVGRTITMIMVSFMCLAGPRMVSRVFVHFPTNSMGYIFQESLSLLLLPSYQNVPV